MYNCTYIALGYFILFPPLPFELWLWLTNHFGKLLFGAFEFGHSKIDFNSISDFGNWITK